MTVYCRKCGQEWRRDPALEVECPTCHAKKGRRCKRPSGHSVWGKEPHEERDRLAMETVPGYSKCAGAPLPELVIEETVSGQMAFVLVVASPPPIECTSGDYPPIGDGCMIYLSDTITTARKDTHR